MSLKSPRGQWVKLTHPPPTPPPTPIPWLLMTWLLASPDHQQPWMFHVGWIGCIPWREIWITSAILVLIIDKKCKHISVRLNWIQHEEGWIFSFFNFFFTGMHSADYKEIFSNTFLQFKMADIDGLAEDCSNSIANALDSLQPCAKPSMWSYEISGHFKCQVSSIPSEMEAMVVYGVSAPSNCLLPANTVWKWPEDKCWLQDQFPREISLLKISCKQSFTVKLQLALKEFYYVILILNVLSFTLDFFFKIISRRFG